MKKVLKFIMNDLEEIILGILLTCMVIVVFLATLGRYTGLYTMSFSDELSRYCMICLIFLGISVGAKKSAHFEGTAVVGLLPSKLQQVVGFIKTAVVVCFNLAIAYYGTILIRQQLSSQQTSPALNLPMWIMYAVVTLGCILMAIGYGYSQFKKFAGMGKKADTENQLPEPK